MNKSMDLFTEVYLKSIICEEEAEEKQDAAADPEESTSSELEEESIKIIQTKKRGDKEWRLGYKKSEDNYYIDEGTGKWELIPTPSQNYPVEDAKTTFQQYMMEADNEKKTE